MGKALDAFKFAMGGAIFYRRSESPSYNDSPAANMMARPLTTGGTAPEDGEGVKVRTIWISDVHLGTRGCNAKALLAFLRTYECETLYLVGDIIDGWKLKRSWYWPQSHNDVVQKILRKARKGTKVIYVPGNHDEAFRDYVGHDFGDITLAKEDVHITADGRKLLVIHGDEFDGVVLYAKWLAVLGDYAYQAALVVNIVLNGIRRRFGMPYWSLSQYLKFNVKNAVKFITNFEQAICQETHRRELDGVVCGHIHHPCIRNLDGIEYYNDGDWVESCSALLEHIDGRMELVEANPHAQNHDELIKRTDTAAVER